MTDPPKRVRTTVRSLAAEAGLPTDAAVSKLAALGIRHGSQKLEGRALREARVALGLPVRRGAAAEEPARHLSRDELIVRLLNPLLAKGKVGPTHTTPIEHVYGKGVPDHQKNEARALVEEFLADGTLGEKVSQGRRHVWLKNRGRAVLEAASGAGE